MPDLITWDRDRAAIVMPHHSLLRVRPVLDVSGRMVVIETGQAPIWLDTDTAEVLGSLLLDAANAGTEAVA